MYKKIKRKIQNFFLIKKCKRRTKSKISSKAIFTDKTVLEGKNSIGKCNLENSFVGKYSYIGSGYMPYTKIGKFCSISFDVISQPYTHDLSFVSTFPGFYSKDKRFFPYCSVKNSKELVKNKNDSAFSVIIGNDVWIGQKAIIKGGITIGDGAVIGIGSVVTKDIPPYAIVGGNPAKIIRFRYPDDTIAKLLASKWWDKDDNWIKENSDLFSDVEELLRALENGK